MLRGYNNYDVKLLLVTILTHYQTDLKHAVTILLHQAYYLKKYL